MTDARRISAVAFAASGALVGGLITAAASLAFSTPGIISLPLHGPLDLLARTALGAGLFALPWALVGAGLAPLLARCGYWEALGLGVGAAVALTVVAVGLPVLLLVGEEVSGEWLRAGSGIALFFSPFGIGSAALAWRRLHRAATP